MSVENKEKGGDPLSFVRAASLHCSGGIDNAELGGMLSVMATGAILRPVATPGQKVIGAKPIVSVRDTKGNVLVAGKNYLLRGETVKVLREEFNAGNIVDTFYYVFYLGKDMEEHLECVDGVYSREGTTYPSPFEPICS